MAGRSLELFNVVARDVNNSMLFTGCPTFGCRVKQNYVKWFLFR